MLKRILHELKEHVPFTMLGAVSGIALMLLIIIARVKPKTLEPAFEGFHAAHVLLSAIVIAGLFHRYRGNAVQAVLVGFVGSVGIATLSDVIFPHEGGILLLKLTAEQHVMDFHLPIVEEPWLIAPAALIGIAIGIWKHKTKVSHTGHILVSTWASLFYLVAHAEGQVNWWPLLPLVLVVLFMSVWVPCCFSDIVFPLLFLGEEAADEHHHGHHDEHEHADAGS